MAYISDADIQERLGDATYIQVADDDGDGTANAGVVMEARLAAEGEVDSYLAARFPVPIDLTVHPELSSLLASITLDLVEVRLRSRRPPVPQDVLRRGATTREWLARIADGTIALPSATQMTTNPARGMTGLVTGEERLLSRDELSGH